MVHGYLQAENPSRPRLLAAGRLVVPGHALRRGLLWYFGTWPLVVAALFLWDPLLALGHFLATHTLAVYGALRSNSQLFGQVVQSFATEEDEVWLTIDDGPFPSDTAAMLETLARHGAKATFFLEGRRAEEQPELVRAIQAAGHTLGNHSQTHAVSRFWAAGPWAARREISRCSAVLHRLLGAEPVGFRPPVGMANGFVHWRARQLGVPVIGWSARGYDGVDHSAEQVAGRIGERLAPGSILLLHQRPSAPGEGPRNAGTLDRVLAEIDRRGYRCVLPTPHQFRHAPPVAA